MFDLPIEIFNVGRNRVNSTSAEVVSEDVDMMSEPVYIGPLDAGTSVTVDAQATASTPGPAQITVRVHYIDDFNQPQVFEGTLEVEIEEGLNPPANGGPTDGSAPVDGPGAERPPRPWWQRLLRGLVGLGSAA